MTAEIAILNKLAVALATDSTVTVSVGKLEHKTYDSADKLFDLSRINPIGIMIYNGLQFMEAPLQTLIAEYRNTCQNFETVKDAAYDFLSFLNDWGANSPSKVLHNTLENLITPAFDKIKEEIAKKQEELFLSKDFTDIQNKFQKIPFDVIEKFSQRIGKLEKCHFVGGKSPKITKQREEIITSLVRQGWPDATPRILSMLVSIVKKLINTRGPSLNQTGLVIAGFGTSDKFPSLISFTIDGVIFDKLRYSQIDFVDIDRQGDSARVMPFAQKEMVERFLYGLDTEIEEQISAWCKDAVPEISDQLIGKLSVSESDKQLLLANARAAEKTFIDDLRMKRFEEIRNSSRSAIEGMVEFMPKPELARMAEALVNLASLKKTCIKRA